MLPDGPNPVHQPGTDPEERSGPCIADAAEIDDFLRAVALHRSAAAPVARRALRPTSLPVAVVREEIRRAIDAEAPVVVFSVDTALKQLAHHPDLTASDYGRIPDLVRNGEATLSATRDSVVFVRRFNGRWYKAAVKRSPKELYLTSFHRVRASDLPRTKRRAARGGAPHPAKAGNPT